MRKKTVGRGLINSVIDKLPFEAHIPGYNYCGPGTKLKKRLSRGDRGINPLDEACKEHDIAYSENKDLEVRHTADRILAEKAWQRTSASDASLGEKAAAWAVTNVMKAKVKLGGGGGGGKRRKGVSVKDVINAARITSPLLSISDGSKKALRKAKRYIKNKTKIRKIPRVLPVPRTGGILPFLVPLFAGLSALGSLAGGATAIAKAVKNTQEARDRLEEMRRHNRKMEEQHVGSGFFLKPYKTGYGLVKKAE
ncbi:uncharacterized protein [Rhodnius prolixus]|uniref:uncharacterized protein n=1 Tax=Rhodnius prolixus TaxID=13249 RepID=UPI003D18C2A6